MSTLPFAVEARAITKRVRDGAGRRTILDGVSMGVTRGEFVVLRGPSGSGKTTLLALLGAMLSPTSGEVFLDGEPTSRLREAYRAETRRHKVGFVFQDEPVIHGMSVRDSVLLPCVPEGIRPGDRRRADGLIERFSLGRHGDRRVETLSGGERQRVALARALIRDPPIVLLDEPTAHLDDARARAIVAALVEIVSDRRAVLVASHDARLVQAPGVSRVLELAEGRLVTQVSGGGEPEVDASAETSARP